MKYRTGEEQKVGNGTSISHRCILSINDKLMWNNVKLIRQNYGKKTYVPLSFETKAGW